MTVLAMSDARLDWHLSNWADMMERTGRFGGYPSRASGGMGRSFSRDFDAMVSDADRRCADAVDAIVESMPPAPRAALYVDHDLTCTWRFPRDNQQDCLARAKAIVRAGLASRGIF